MSNSSEEFGCVAKVKAVNEFGQAMPGGVIMVVWGMVWTFEVLPYSGRGFVFFFSNFETFVFS